jgi:hypothetical protein
MATIIKQLKNDKIQISFNKNPIPMQLFISFLTIPVERSKGYLGESTGWSQYHNTDAKLVFTGGVCDGGHWLDHIQYGTKLQNPYNNYVNPFYLFDIMNGEGKQFFINYYKDDIEAILKKQKQDVAYAKKCLADEKAKLLEIKSEYDLLLTPNPKQ